MIALLHDSYPLIINARALFFSESFRCWPRKICLLRIDHTTSVGVAVLVVAALSFRCVFFIRWKRKTRFENWIKCNFRLICPNWICVCFCVCVKNKNRSCARAHNAHNATCSASNGEMMFKIYIILLFSKWNWIDAVPICFVVFASHQFWAYPLRFRRWAPIDSLRLNDLNWNGFG